MLHGLPVAHKDLETRRASGRPAARRSTRTTFRRATRSSSSEFAAAGAITVGKTNTPEFGAGSQTFNAVFGATLNPYDLTKTCGGSSGGAAVALACGMVPMADGSDMGGSLRNPAGFCNVVGLRTSPGRVPIESGSWNAARGDRDDRAQVGDVRVLSERHGGSGRANLRSRSRNMARDSGSRSTEKFKDVRVAWWKGLGGVSVEPEIRGVIDASEGLRISARRRKGRRTSLPLARRRGRCPATRSTPPLLGTPEWVKDPINTKNHLPADIGGRDGRALARRRACTSRAGSSSSVTTSSSCP